jgi:hypothetical protein
MPLYTLTGFSDFLNVIHGIPVYIHSPASGAELQKKNVCIIMLSLKEVLQNVYLYNILWNSNAVDGTTAEVLWWDK